MKKKNGFIKSLLGRPRNEAPDSLRLSVLGFLIEQQKHGDALRSDIVHQYALKPATADSLLDNMEREGLIVRESRGGQEHIALTGRGYDFYHNALHRIWNLDLNPDAETADPTEKLTEVVRSMC